MISDSLKQEILAQLEEDGCDPKDAIIEEYEATLAHVLSYIESKDKGELICAMVHYDRVPDYMEATDREYVSLDAMLKRIENSLS